MASLADYIRDIQKKHPGNNRRNKALNWEAVQPTLLKGRTNRIMIFVGSFNPPHIGHLNLLTHAFYHGGQDLDVRAAIISTSSDSNLKDKFEASGETMRFSKKDRDKLWKYDERLPEWAWVYEDSSSELKALRRRLREKARLDGYDLEYVLLYGPDGLDLYEHEGVEEEPEVVEEESKGVEEEPEGVEEEPEYYRSDYNHVLICDVSRKAVSLDQNETLRRFHGFEPWRKLELDEQSLEQKASVEAEKVLEILKEKAPEEYQRAVERGDHSVKPSFVDTIKDSEHIWVCAATHDAKLQWRFVRFDRSAPDYKETEISSTVLRAAMKTGEGDQLMASLKAMALSPERLWARRSRWSPHLQAAVDGEKRTN